MFFWRLKYATHQVKLHIAFISNNSLPSFITFFYCMTPMHLLTMFSLQSQIQCCINILHLLSFLFPTSTHPSLLLKVGISYSPLFPFYKNRADLCLKGIYGYVPQNDTTEINLDTVWTTWNHKDLRRYRCRYYICDKVCTLPFSSKPERSLSVEETGRWKIMLCFWWLLILKLHCRQHLELMYIFS